MVKKDTISGEYVLWFFLNKPITAQHIDKIINFVNVQINPKILKVPYLVKILTTSNEMKK